MKAYKNPHKLQKLNFLIPIVFLLLIINIGCYTDNSPVQNDNDPFIIFYTTPLIALLNGFVKGGGHYGVCSMISAKKFRIPHSEIQNCRCWQYRNIFREPKFGIDCPNIAAIYPSLPLYFPVNSHRKTGGSLRHGGQNRCREPRRPGRFRGYRMPACRSHSKDVWHWQKHKMRRWAPR